MAGPLDPRLEAKLDEAERRAEELSVALANPEITSDLDRYKQVSRAYAELEPVIAKFREYRKTGADLVGVQELLGTADDAEMKAMATQEVKELEERLGKLEQELKLLLLPTDPHDEKNVVIEIRAGTGGDEATLFAAELFRMYVRYAEGRRWKVRLTDHSESSVGGSKEVIAIVEGDGVYSRLKFDSPSGT